MFLKMFEKKLQQRKPETLVSHGALKPMKIDDTIHFFIATTKEFV